MLLEYQQKVPFKDNLTPVELQHHKKQMITAYLEELEFRMWNMFQHDENLDEEKTKEIIIGLSKQMNNEWNNHRATKQDCWMEHSAFIQLASVTFGFPIQIVPIMK